MAKNRIVCGGETFTEEKIRNAEIFLSNSISFDELSVDTFDAELDFSAEVGTFFAPADYDRFKTVDDLYFVVKPYFRILVTDPSKFTYGKQVEYYRDDKIFQIFYMSTIKRVSKWFFAISCVSAVGLLDTITHYGGLYTGQTFSAVVASITGGAIRYTVASNVANLRVYGWLPVASCRDNLRQLLFASGVALKKDSGGNVAFELLNSSVPLQIPDSRIMLDGNVEYPASVSEAVVVEHAFFSTSLDETVTLYDGDAVAGTFVTPGGVLRSGILVTFDEPAYSLSASGVSILESGVNYAVLSGGGHAILTGKKYTHTTREVKKTIASGSANMVGEKNAARVENATLVTALNSEVVADRIAGYYSSTRTLNQKILVNSERPGDFISLHDPFGESEKGIIASMDINVSGTLLADTKIVSGYTPVSGGGYENVVRLTGSGTFTVPAGKTKIRVVLIGGGWGGWSGRMGKRGTAGTTAETSDLPHNTRVRTLKTGEGGAGGLPGEGGSGGDIFQVTIDVTPFQAFSYSCGVGGPGGVSNKNRGVEDDVSVIGTKGGASVFGSWSSASGSSGDYGFVDILSGNTYAGRGTGGISGGKGGGFRDGVDIRQSQQPGPNIVYNGITYQAGENNSDFVSVDRSVSMGSYEGDTNRPMSWSITAGAMYGAGGGAAAGANGNKSTVAPSASASASANSFGRSGSATGGPGGQGADAVPPAKETRYGYGGKGGNGGGGQGGPGAAEISTFAGGYAPGTDPGMPTNLTLSQNIGTGSGLGSDGGAGGDGCILVYY